jgi:centromere-localized protein 2
MAPQLTEDSILTSYLLAPASLPTIVPYPLFQTYFPPAVRSSPEVKALYRDLQFLRTVDMDVVKENIGAECKKGDRMKVEMLRSLDSEGRKKGDSEDMQTIGMDTALFGISGSVPGSRGRHSVESLLREMEDACDQLDRESAATETEIQRLLGHLREIVGGLSDLRYGKFAKAPGTEEGDMEREVVGALRVLENACDQAVNR